MKLKQLLVLPLMIALVLPVLAEAKIYKWKETNGVTRYSDIKPLDRVEVDEIGRYSKVKPKPIQTEGTDSTDGKVKATETAEGQVDPKEAAEEETARLRAEKAEKEKIDQQNKAAAAKVKAANCRSAKANYQTFAQGGRVYEMDENGERQYFDDSGLNARKAQAQVKVNQYCY